MTDIAFPASNDVGGQVGVLPKRKRRKKRKKEPRFNVVLWNDEEHTFDYVILLLKSLFGYPVAEGFRIAKTIHLQGKAIIFTSSLGQAEIKRDQILAFGSDPFMDEPTGPLQATIEKVRTE